MRDPTVASFANNGELVPKYPAGASFVLEGHFMREPTNQAVDGPAITTDPEPRRRRWRGLSISWLIAFAFVTIALTGFGWFILGVEGAILAGFVCALAIIFTAVQKLLLPSPTSPNTKTPNAAETYSRPDERLPLKTLRWSIRAKTAMVREFVARATGRTRRVVLAAAIVGAATGGCFQVVVHAWPEGLRVRAIADAVSGAAAFALVGAMLGALVDRLAAPFLKRFDESSAKLRLICGAMCGGIIGALAVAVFGIGLLTMVFATAKAHNPQVRWQDVKIGEMILGAIVLPMTWGLFIGAISGIYAARGR
jgi:hypothetical protein